MSENSLDQDTLDREIYRWAQGHPIRIAQETLDKAATGAFLGPRHVPYLRAIAQAKSQWCFDIAPALGVPFDKVECIFRWLQAHGALTLNAERQYCLTDRAKRLVNDRPSEENQ